MISFRMKLLTAFLAGFVFLNLAAQSPTGYQVPPQPIADLVNAPQTPLVSLNADGDWMVLIERPGYPDLAELAQPELRLGGLRINPRTNGQSRAGSYTGLTFQQIATGQQVPVTGLPANARIQNVSWSPDGQAAAFTIEEEAGHSLWYVPVATGEARQLLPTVVNDVMNGNPFTWMPDSRSLLVKTVPEGRGVAPVKPLLPEGPVVQVATGVRTPVRTYQDLLQNPHDEAVFAYYTTSDIISVEVGTGNRANFGNGGIIAGMSPSPDGNYVLVTYVEQPFSYIVPYSRFAQRVVMYDAAGTLVTTIAQIPVSDNIPKGFGATRKGPRSFSWRADKPATLTWVEALDEGNPAIEAEYRDQLFLLEAPFTGAAVPSIKFQLRYGGVTWGTGQLAIAYEWWWTTRQEITSRFKPDDANSKQVLFDRSSEDRYNDPGNFVTAPNAFGEEVLLTGRNGRELYLTGTGASPEGNRPFIRSFDLNTRQTKELWRSQAPYYETPVAVLSIDKGLVVTRRESIDSPPNYYLRDVKKNTTTALTSFPHPYPQLQGIEKQVINYTRADGLALKGNLYLPADWQPADGPLPVLMWAYPDEFKSAAAAGQVQGSPFEFLRLGWYSPLYFVTRGYAIFDDVSMPIIGEGEVEPNDNFREQLVANAAAAIDTLVQMGIADRNRIAIGGHSYGAFMTANLMAHSDLFAAGIARSGAYNRTLTPFGFQSEERTYWDSPEVYYDMSPFSHADKINEPLLIIHGEADNNPGTFPMQSERLFAAIKGLGGKSRLVMLPHESHGYQGRESILHMLWEMNEFLEKEVKNK